MTVVLAAQQDHEKEMKVKRLFQLLVKRLPAVLNKTDYTIGFKCDMPRILRVLDLLGFHMDLDGKATKILHNNEFKIRLVVPREDWFPILQYIN